MSRREQLNLYIGQVQQRLRLDASVRGAAVVAAVALVATVLLTLILNAICVSGAWADSCAAGAAWVGCGCGGIWVGAAVAAIESAAIDPSSRGCVS